VNSTETSFDSSITVSVSTAFYPGASIDDSDSDIILLSSDGILFYTHSHRLLAASHNNFNGLIPAHISLDNVFAIPEPAATINIFLHFLYDISCVEYNPSFNLCVSAVHALRVYGIPAQEHSISSNPFFILLRSFAALHPLALYTLAAEYDLESICVITSSHLLSLFLPSITEADATRMGPLYLRRLFLLHFDLASALRKLLLLPPYPHAPTTKCSFLNQKDLVRAWALATAYLAWEAQPDLTNDLIETAFGPLIDRLTCKLCQQGMTKRVKEVVAQWSIVKRTI